MSLANKTIRIESLDLDGDPINNQTDFIWTTVDVLLNADDGFTDQEKSDLENLKVGESLNISSGQGWEKITRVD
jgi:hypothetical protein|tara:strand:- start:423 stop:644 length:222 start_codon:yes stop_codon:yes gene_type:complete